MEECFENMSGAQARSVNDTILNSQESNLGSDSKISIPSNETETDPDKLKIDSQEKQKKDPLIQSPSEAETDFQIEEREAVESGTQTPIQEITYVLLIKQIGSISKEEAEKKLKDLFTKMVPEQRRRYFEIHNLESKIRESGLDYDKILQGINNKDEPNKVPPHANQNDK